MAGFGDQREVELLVEAGFAPEKAIEIATSNGAEFLDQREIGTIAPQMRADLIVINGDPVQRIADIRNVETVFKEGVAYDPGQLIADATGRVGSAAGTWGWASWPSVVVLVLLPVVLVRRLRKRGTA